MKLYLAPLEGITSYIYRKALYQCFDGFDKYFIPFIRAKQNLNFSGREKKDISPENNSGMYAVPQILTRNADDFLRTANQLKEYGYQEVNLNLGCPSKTVVTKGCGAGFLARPEELEQFLDRIYQQNRYEDLGEDSFGDGECRGISKADGNLQSFSHGRTDHSSESTEGFL